MNPIPLVAAALRAPSGDNCQPFRYRWDGRALDVVHVAERAYHVLDSGHHPSRLTLGMIQESLAIAAATQGLAIHSELLPAKPDAAWLRVTFTAATPYRDSLYDGLEARHTDRRLFRGGAMNAPVLRACVDEGTSGIEVHTAPPTALTSWLDAADAAIWKAPKVAQDALDWVRFDEQELRRRGDGVSWRNLGLPPALAAGVAVSRRMPWTLTAGAVFGGPLLTASLLRQQLRSSAAIVTIGVHDPSPATLVRAGRVAWRVWAHLNLAGWGAQPMSMGPILSMASRDHTLPASVPAAVGQDMLGRVPALRRSLGTESSWFPTFMLRTGRMSPLDSRIRPPRRALSEMLEHVPR